MHNFECFWKGKRITVQATSTFEAQKKAAVIWKVKKGYEIAVVNADVPVNTASI